MSAVGALKPAAARQLLGDRDTDRSSAAEADAMRQELSKYLDNMKNKVDTEGNPLISFPDNFDSIAAAMDREDLEAEQEKPWSRYLLEHSLDDSNDEEGRHSSAEELKRAEEDKRLQRGLAEIQMLDKQLKAAARKELSSQRSAPALTLDEAAFGRGEEGDDEPSTGRSSAASSRYGGKTFLTRLKSDVYLGEESRQNSARTQCTEDDAPSAQFTPRKGPRSGEGSPSVDLADSLLRRGEGAGSPGAPEGLARPPSRPEARGEVIPAKKNFIEENRTTVQGYSRLNPEQQIRISSLLGFNDLDVDEGADFAELEKRADKAFEKEWNKISSYGYNQEEKQYMQSLDDRLRVLRGDPPAGEPAVTGPEAAAAPDGGRGPSSAEPNYLVAQRAERTREAYTHQIDLAIRSIKRPITEESLMGLVDCSDDSHDGQSAERLTGHRTRSGGSSRRTSSSRRIGKAHSVRELPKLEDISPGHVIGMDEVLDVIDELCHPERLQASSPVDECEPPAVAAVPAIEVAPRSELDALLGRLRPEIIQLASLRNRKRDQESRQRMNTNLSGGNPNGAKNGFSEDQSGDFLEMCSIPKENMTIEHIASSAAQFAEQAAAAAQALISERNRNSRKSKSSKIRGEVRAVKNVSLDSRRIANGSGGSGGDFDISRGAVASEMSSGTSRPRIRLCPEKSADDAGELLRDDYARPNGSQEDEEVIYSAPSSAQSAIRPLSDVKGDNSFYQSSRRQQAAREQMRSRERAATSEYEQETKGFLPQLPSSSQRVGSEYFSDEKLPNTLHRPGEKKMKKEPPSKITSKLSSAVVKPDAATFFSDSPLKASRASAVGKARSVDCSSAELVPDDNEAASKMGIERQPSRELRTLSSGLDDVHNKLSRLLARADRAHDGVNDDDEIDTDSDSCDGCGDDEYSGLVQRLVHDHSKPCDPAEEAVRLRNEALPHTDPKNENEFVVI